MTNIKDVIDYCKDQEKDSVDALLRTLSEKDDLIIGQSKGQILAYRNIIGLAEALIKHRGSEE